MINPTKRQTSDSLQYSPRSEGTESHVNELALSLAQHGRHASFSSSQTIQQPHVNNSRSDSFVVPATCFLEDKDILPPANTYPIPEQAHGEDLECLPVRILDNFVLLDVAKGGQLASPAQIEQSDADIRVYGYAKCHSTIDDGDDDEQDEEVEEVTELLSSRLLLYFLDPKPTKPLLWLRSQRSWFILHVPATEYQKKYYAFWKPRYLARLALLVTQTAQEHFRLQLANIMQHEIGGSLGVRGYIFSEDDVLQSVSDNRDITEDLLLDAVEAGWQTARSCLNELYPQFTDEHVMVDQPSLLVKQRNSGRHLSLNRSRGYPRTDKAILQHYHVPFFTPFVCDLATSIGLFPTMNRNWTHHPDAVDWPVWPSTVKTTTAVENASSTSFDMGQKRQWVLREQGYLEQSDGACCALYQTASCHRFSLNTGDFVATTDHQGGMKRSTKAKRRFARVGYFLKNKDDCSQYAHVQWFDHSCKTLERNGESPLLGQAGDLRELFMLNDCETLPLDTIISKISATYVSPGETFPDEEGDTTMGPVRFYFRYMKQKDGSLVNAQPLPIFANVGHLNSADCTSCHTKTAERQAEVIQQTSEGLLFQNIPYHCQDYVYFAAHNRECSDQVWYIGQVKAVKRRYGTYDVITLTVQLLDRYDDLVRDFEGLGIRKVKDPRRLCMTQIFYEVSPRDLRGRCCVHHCDEIPEFHTWSLPNDHFWVDCLLTSRNHDTTFDPHELVELLPEQVIQCNDSECRAERNGTVIRVPKQKLRCLDLFHGAGGLGLGLKLAGCTETKWGVDFSPSAHETFKKNFPQAKSILHDSNQVLRRAMERNEGREGSVLYQIGSNHLRCPELPRPGEVDIIICGPPCQGFSKLNLHANAGDIRNSLVGNALSYVDHLRPRFVLLENVEPLTTTSTTLCAQDGGEEAIVEKAFTKFIVAFFARRDYQVRYKVLQAGQYGTPQDRKRVFFWAAKRGERLPDFPAPTHTWKSKNDNERDETGGAPLPFVTVEDAISDLPEWHWDWDDNRLKRPDPELPRPAGRRVPAVTPGLRIASCGFNDWTAYPANPATTYQQTMRKDSEGVRYHSTNTYSAQTVELVCNIPPPQPELGIPEGLDWRDMNLARAPVAVAHPHARVVGDSKRDAKYARVYSQKPAQTVITRVRPDGIMSRVLHYSQYRVLSAQENARLQGFPDSFTFVSATNEIADIYRLIGNAVPIPLVYQLGLELGKALIAKEAEDAEMSDIEASPELGYADLGSPELG